MEEIRQEELARVDSIKNARNIAALGPLVLGVVNIDLHKVLLAGVDFKASAILKPWWQMSGKLPDDNSVILGAEAARILNGKTSGNQEQLTELFNDIASNRVYGSLCILAAEQLDIVTANAEAVNTILTIANDANELIFVVSEDGWVAEKGDCPIVLHGRCLLMFSCSTSLLP